MQKALRCCVLLHVVASHELHADVTHWKRGQSTNEHVCEMVDIAPQKVMGWTYGVPSEWNMGVKLTCSTVRTVPSVSVMVMLPRLVWPVVSVLRATPQAHWWL